LWQPTSIDSEVVIDFWNHFDIATRGALIGAIATAAASFLALLGVGWQIARQAKIAIEQNRDSERLKLKLSIYETITLKSQEALNSSNSFQGYMNVFNAQARVAHGAIAGGEDYLVPAADVMVLIQKKVAATQKMTELRQLISRWMIVDPRLDLFALGLEVASNDLDWAYEKYQKLAFLIMPAPHNAGASAEFVKWQPPSDEAIRLLDVVSKEMQDAWLTQLAFVQDFQLEMQNLLLKDLFNRRLPPRTPDDPKAIVLRMDFYDELKALLRKRAGYSP
jgi:hypothetical protein